jgi:hypothetical protein
MARLSVEALADGDERWMRPWADNDASISDFKGE